MNIDKIFQSKTFKIILAAIGGLMIILLVFKTGMMVGFQKANFSCHWSDNYHQNFGGPRGGFPGGFGDRDFIEANGSVGQIIKIATSTLVIRGRGNVEKVVLIKADTVINQLKETITINELKTDDMVVVIGEPNNDGQIEAKLIRVMPAIPRHK
ncbi:hypothetical protein COX74_00130 [bacterium (Candidatus Gribaldobacteria) CG_4_10_14_0_2_um_filter_41_16]|uniref:DUF5666 domain-containing protein n=4 Tax=Candidatus Gribaldobacteria TaxID=2798536 RepID=A0A2M7VJB9_9BACT|nr:MAG: hypothetical protein COU03_01620 [bacterium (Candidatus Gribaldobacteria) CG10_big_fil_rev_8_21_14_0_10_41_12]PIV46739.1 MAG: hypothetical protein COS21_03825 [bacterium (Candidatus Gribaldobacteria) CG02_land_8_20_14_3_00_41_15]PIX02971.1 MAG: hypothetical protein COZ78_02855 [bacterium (Candidatus Gribaldobacteria) CG_4_8_14_3_um_filter_42_11]PJA01932.1 MAG: hypothetical protein COX74_00130 [bacterium (Candidatus Gribaldobacteria) CG_4_10_14_0_2_um_filter_41_16]